MALFDRARPWAGTSLAMAVFRRQFTELNDQYWAVLPAEAALAQLTAASPPHTPTVAAFSPTTPNLHRVGHDLEEAQSRLERSRAWARPLTLILVSAALETYLGSITRSAQLSDPAAKPGFPKALDGVTLLKQGIAVDASAWIHRCDRRVSAESALPAATMAVLDASTAANERAPSE